MRCLGRLVLLCFLLIVGAFAWLYRDEIARWVRGTLHPETIVQRTGHPSPAALRSATDKLESFARSRRDSIVLTADEVTSLLARGTSFLAGSTFDSLSIELGEGTIRVRTMVDSARISRNIRRLLPGKSSAFEELVASGALTPVRPGLAEFTLQHVRVHGIPLPADLVARTIGEASGRNTGKRVEVTLPEGMSGFRVKPEGVTVYRSAQ